jgi:ribose transport system permease protein
MSHLTQIERRLLLANSSPSSSSSSTAATIDGFGQWFNVKSSLTLGGLLALATLGQTLVMILGGLDLSTRGFLVMGAVVFSQLYGSDGWPTAAAILVPALMGATTGWIRHYHPFNR